MENKLVTVSNEELQDINGGGALGVVGGALMILGACVSGGGALVVGVGVIGGVATVLSSL